MNRNKYIIHIGQQAVISNLQASTKSSQMRLVASWVHEIDAVDVVLGKVIFEGRKLETFA